jgi:hypothetical protein
VAEVKLTVRTNFTEAEKELQKLGGTVASTIKTMSESEKNLASKNIDQYIEKQSRLATAMSITRGQTESNAKLQTILRNEYEKLYKNGIDPTIAGMVRLENEYKQLENYKHGMVALTTASTAAITAVGAVGVAMVANTAQIAGQIDKMTESAATLGLTTQEYQKLSFVSERTGASMEGMDSAIQKMNVGIGQARNGSGALFEALSKTNPQLLEQVMNAESSADAFALMMDEVGSTSNQFDRVALASAAFGKGTREIVNTALAGGDSIRSLMTESERYGVVTDAMVKKSGAFDDAQKNVQASLFGVRAHLAEKLMPALTVVMQGFADFISDGGKLKAVMVALAPVVVGVTTAIVGLLIATKAQAAINALVGGMAALNAVMLANPAALIVAGIAAVVTAIVLIRKNWDSVVWGWTVGINAMKIVLGDLVLIVADKFIPIIVKIFETLGKIPVVGKIYQGIADGISGVTEKMKTATIAMQANSSEAIKNADAKYEASKKEKEVSKAVETQNNNTAKSYVALSDAQKQALKTAEDIASSNIEEQSKKTLAGRIALIEKASTLEETAIRNSVMSEQKKADAIMAIRKNMNESIEKEKVADYNSTPKAVALTETSQKLNLFTDDSAVLTSQQLATFDSFYTARLDQKTQFMTAEQELDFQKQENKIAFIEAEQRRILDMKILGKDEEIRLEEATEARKKAIQQATTELIFDNARKRIGEASSFAGDIQKIMQNAGKQFRALAIIQKGLAIADVGMKSVQLVMQAALSAPFPANIPAVAWATMKGAASTIAVASTPIPSAETGVRDFTVPDSTRVDASYLKVNRDEKVSVTPRGESGSKMQETSIFLDGKLFLRQVQEYIDSGALKITTDNIIGAF